MKIVVLDGYTLNPGDLSWDGLKDLGDVTIHDYTPADQIVARAQDAEILFTNKTPLTAATLAQLNKLTYIGVLATGYNVVDVKAAAARGVAVTNIPTYGTSSVAQMVFALLLELCHHVQLHSDAVRGGEWSASRDFCFWKTPLVELQGKTIGIVGFGRIGRQVAKIADAFGMRVLAQDKFQGPAPDLADFRWAELDELLAQSDVVSLHCPLFPDTAGLINQETLARMKPSTFLINTSRGGLIVDQDLSDALNRNQIAGAALDVLSVEPPPADNPLLKAKNILVTPHISWATAEARARLMGIAVDNLKAYLAGKPVNVIKV
ncbi:MAG: D-2-hydroxyacid dehydrogenase [Eubacteriales bacterium]|nr:D-2-hydroxyacid dehydrogenase [Eubacteriales bacterium]MDD4743546.1 D-2-hydroxyacid dehydrogenase [Eubacteriales bacterium]